MYLEGRLKNRPGTAINSSSLKKRPTPDSAPLAFGQEQLFFLDQLHPGSAAYNRRWGLELVGKLNRTALMDSILELVKRHEVLRINVAVVEGRSRAIIHPYQSFEVPFTDFSSSSSKVASYQAHDFAVKESQRHFNLSSDRLFRPHLIRIEPTHHVLLLNTHHIIFDGWSERIFFRQLANFYNSYQSNHIPSDPFPPLQFPDFAHFQRNKVSGDHLQSLSRYWKKRLQDGAPFLKLATDYPRPAYRTTRGERISMHLSAQTTNSLKDLSRATDATLFMTLFAAFTVLLSKLSSQDDILAGAIIAGRNYAQLEEVIGFFANTLVLRTDLSDDPSFSHLLRQVRETSLEAYDHQDMPFETLVEILNPPRNPSYTPLIQATMQLRNLPEFEGKLTGIQVNNYDLGYREAIFDLNLGIDETAAGLSCKLLYNNDLFSESTAKRILQQYKKIINVVISNPGTVLSTIIDNILSMEQTSDSQILRPRSSKRVSETNLTPTQLLMWTGQKFRPTIPLYNLTYAFTIHDRLNPQAFRDAFGTLLSKSDALRTIIEEKDYVPHQKTRTNLKFELPIIDLSNERDADGAAQDWIEAHYQKVFNFEERLFNTALLKITDERWIWYLNLHHILFDFKSIELIFRRMEEYYKLALQGDLINIPELPAFRDFTHWEKSIRSSPDYPRIEAYWDQKFAQGMEPLSFYGHRAIKRSTIVHRKFLILGVERTKKLRQMAESLFFTKTKDASLLNIFVALLFAFIHRSTGIQDLSIAIPFHNRSNEKFRETIGLLMEMLIFRVSIEPTDTFSSLIKKVTLEALETLKYRNYPMANTLSKRVYEVYLNFMTPVFSDFLGADVNVADKYRGHDEDSLAIQIQDYEGTGSLKMQFDFHGDVFRIDDEKRSLDHFERILDAFLENPDQKLNQVDLLSLEEREQVLSAPNDTGAYFPESATIIELFEEQVQKTPENTAVSRAGDLITYAELNSKANQVAHRLRAQSMLPDDRVGLYIDRSIEMLIGLLGILKAGAAYLPIDPTFPLPRIDFILQDSGANIVLTHSSLKSNLANKKLTVLCLDDWGNFSPESVENPSMTVGPENLAYVIYTSGSTGKPKGVMIEHRSLVNFTHWAREAWSLEEQDRVLQFTSLSWDAHIEEIFPTLSSGAAIVLRTPEMIETFTSFLDLSRDWGITMWDLPTSYWHELTQAIIADQLPIPPSLRRVVIGGQQANRAQVQEWKTVIRKEIRLFNCYGLSETTSIATQFDFADEEKDHSGEVSIGTPIQNVQVYVLDQHMNPLPRGLTGEVWIGGAGLARGYINRPELNSSLFAANPFRNSSGDRIFKTGDLARYLPGGNLEFMGRADQQVKIRGYRIELGEIEVALSRHPAVRETAVLARGAINRPSGSDADEKRLVAYVVSDSSYRSDLSRAEFQDFLHRTLPDFMVPYIYVMLDDLPMTATGKIDRQALPDPEGQALAMGSSFQAPSNDIEWRLAAIWEDVLGVKPIGVMDNFFDLGGHSLLAVRLFSVIEKEIGANLPLMTLFESPTIAHQASYLHGELSDDETHWVVEITRTGTRPPFFCISPSVVDIITYRDLSRNMGPDQPFYALYSDRLGLWQKGKEYLEDIAKEFTTKIREISPEGPYLLGGYSAGGHIALAIAQQLTREDGRVALVVLFDTFGPDYPLPLPWVTPRIMRLLRLIRRIESYFWKFRILDWERRIKYLRLPKIQSWLFDRYGETKNSEMGISLHEKIFDSSIRSKSHFKAYSGDALLVRAEKGMLGIRKDPGMGWDSVFTGNFDISMVPGNHEDILFGPRSAIVAKQLNKRITAALARLH